MSATSLPYIPTTMLFWGSILLLCVQCQKAPNPPSSFRGLSFEDNYLQAQFWIPTAEKVALWIYNESGRVIDSLAFRQMDSLWRWQGECEYENYRYRLAIRREGIWQAEVDPYATVVTANASYGYICDLTHSNPPHWADDNRIPKPNQPVIYELQIRDFSSDTMASFRYPGQFLAFTERGLTNQLGDPIGIDYLKEIGITHVHLLPFFDFASINELADRPSYNWGYDPLQFNAVEGSFSSDPRQPLTRIKECKQMIQSLHDAGIGVIMDVVYNHTSERGKKRFDHIASNAFFRLTPTGQLSNASACGNETANEHPEMKRFIWQSLCYWMDEFHIDGFRFDLMGIHEVSSMKEIEADLVQRYPDILLYGEGWKAGPSILGEKSLLGKCNIAYMNHMAAFSDEFRNGLKGNVFEEQDAGWIGGDTSAKESITYGLVGASSHPQVDPKKVPDTDCGFWAAHPNQCIAYASCHDNHTIYDKLSLALPHASHEEIIQRIGLAHALVLTGLGRPFLHAGSEMGRTKQYVENSFESPDSINCIHWLWRREEKELVEWVKDLILLRKENTVWHDAHPLPTSSRIQFHACPSHCLSYTLRDTSGQEQFWVILQLSSEDKSFHPPEKEWALRLSWPLDEQVRAKNMSCHIWEKRDTL